MSVPAAPPLPPAAPAARPDPSANNATKRPSDRQVTAAARQFEGLLLQQVLKALWETAPGMSGPSAGMYQQMFQGPLAEHLAQAGGIGLRPMLERAMRQEQNAPTPPPADAIAPANMPAVSSHALSAPAVGTLSLHPKVQSAAPAASAPVSPDSGALARIQGAAASLLQRGGERWSKAGALQPSDLMPDPSAAGGSAAQGSIRDARGYQGYYKCNLFALETARRAGFDVPVVGSAGARAYPLSNDITRDAADGQLSGQWARVVTGTPASDLDASLQSGARALMLTGAGSGEHHGHMAVVERVRSVEYGTDGQVRRVVFDGWEARPDGARHLRERTWNVQGHEGGHDARNGFDRIEILELRQAHTETANSGRSTSVANAGQTGDFGSSPGEVRPIQSSEED